MQHQQQQRQQPFDSVNSGWWFSSCSFDICWLLYWLVTISLAYCISRESTKYSDCIVWCMYADAT